MTRHDNRFATTIMTAAARVRQLAATAGQFAGAVVEFAASLRQIVGTAGQFVAARRKAAAQTHTYISTHVRALARTILGTLAVRDNVSALSGRQSSAFRKCPSARLVPGAAVSVALVVLAAMTACDRRPLEVYYEGVTRMRFNFDWETYFKHVPNKPEDVSFCLYSGEGEPLFERRVPTTVRYHEEMLPVGHYNLLVFTPSDDWTGSATFATDTFSTAVCRAEQLQMREYKDWDRGTRYMADPLNPIGVAVDTFDITPEMLEHYLQFVDYHKRGIKADTLHITRDETIHPMTTHLFVRILMHGIDNVHAVEGNISGMADGFWMNRVDRTTESGILLLEQAKWAGITMDRAPADWRAAAQRQKAPYHDLDDGKWGWITTDIETFGMPDGKETQAARDSTDNRLTLAFMLRDGSVKPMTFNVGKTIRYLTPTGDAMSKAEKLQHIEVEVIIDDPTIAPDIPDVPTGNEGSGFDAKVSPWDIGDTYTLWF